MAVMKVWPDIGAGFRRVALVTEPSRARALIVLTNEVRDVLYHIGHRPCGRCAVERLVARSKTLRYPRATPAVDIVTATEFSQITKGMKSAPSKPRLRSRW